MTAKDKILLTTEKKKEMIAAIKTYFFNEREEELSDLASMMILEFIIEELAPEFYNQGVNDSYRYLNNSIEDLLSIQK